MASPEQSEAKTADQLYDVWGRGTLRRIVNSIQRLKEEWNEREAKIVMKELAEARHKSIDDFVDLKTRYNPGFTSKNVVFMELEFPDGSDQGEWLGYAKKAAMRIEQFRSHALRRNPNPQRPRKPSAREDTRPLRSHDEQEWLVAEDILAKHQTKQEKKHMRKTRQDEGKKGMPGKGQKKRRTRSKKHDKKPTTPMHGGDSIDPAIQPYQRAAPATEPYQRAAPAIQPYQRAAPRQPPRTAARLPAFPAFPRY